MNIMVRLKKYDKELELKKQKSGIKILFSLYRIYTDINTLWWPISPLLLHLSNYCGACFLFFIVLRVSTKS